MVGGGEERWEWVGVGVLAGMCGCEDDGGGVVMGAAGGGELNLSREFDMAALAKWWI